MMEIVTACTMDCPDACSLIATQKPNGKVILKGNPQHPITSGFTCAKIRKHIDRLNSPHRKVTPLIRENDLWKTITWDSALDLCAHHMNRLRNTPEKLLHIHGESSKGVLKQAGKLFFNHYNACRTRGSVCDAAGFLAYMYDFGSRCNHDPQDLLNSRWIVSWGKDFRRSSVHLGAFVQKALKKGARLITISPGAGSTTGDRDRLIHIRPGTDRFLAAAVIRRFIEHQLISYEILECTRHWENFKKLILNLEEKTLLNHCDIDKQHLDMLFRIYSKKTPVATLVGTGLQRYDFGGETVRFINALALISDNIGIAGGGSYYHLHNLRNFNTDWIKSELKSSRKSFLVPKLGEEILNADPPLDMVWVNGSNLVNQLPDIHTTVRAFESIPFKVVVDAFMTDTASRADLFLPSTLMMEQKDLIGSYLHDFVHYVPAIFKPPGQARSDFDIFVELGKRLHRPIELPNPETIFSEALQSNYLNVSLEDLKVKKFMRADRPIIPYENLQFDHSDAKYRFPTRLHPEPPAPKKYPYRLLSLIRRKAIHSQILPEDQTMPPMVWIARESPVWKQLNPEKPSYLVTKKGRIKVQVKVMEGLHPEVIVYRRGDWMKLGGGVNQLIEAYPTDLGGGTAYYRQYATIEQIGTKNNHEQIAATSQTVSTDL
jgi:anaerobic selenocysteine-containing dehydrogenase